MTLDLTDEETAALTQELHNYRRERPLPVLATHPHAEGDPTGNQTELSI
jgi:hypothetical protein